MTYKVGRFSCEGRSLQTIQRSAFDSVFERKGEKTVLITSSYPGSDGVGPDVTIEDLENREEE